VLRGRAFRRAETFEQRRLSEATPDSRSDDRRGTVLPVSARRLPIRRGLHRLIAVSAHERHAREAGTDFDGDGAFPNRQAGRFIASTTHGSTDTGTVKCKSPVHM